MKKLDYVIVYVSDMNRSTDFYRNVLQLPLKFPSPEWTEFATEGTTIALHRTDGKGTRDGAGTPPAGRAQLGFQVPDIAAFHKRVGDMGTICLKEPFAQDFGTMAIYADPDGMAITVLQPR